MKIIIIIPLYNDRLFIIKLLKEIRNYTDLPILIVDDGSEFPLDIVEISENNTTLLSNLENRGKGAVLMQGFHWAVVRGFTHAITIDADLQHDPSFLPKFIEADPKLDMVIGKRDFNIQMPFHRKMSNYLTSLIVSLFCQTKFQDSQCGYRRYKLNSVMCWNYEKKGFQFESEVIMKIIGFGRGRMVQIPIPTIYNNNTSSIQNIEDTFKFIQLMLKGIFWKIQSLKPSSN